MTDHLTELTKLADYTECPYCSQEKGTRRSRIQAEGRESQHCSGEWREYRVFTCGLKVRYNTNFECVELQGECTYCEAYTQKLDKLDKVKLKLWKYIEKLDISPGAKQRLLNAYEVRNLY
jgi:hypothetical protein